MHDCSPIRDEPGNWSDAFHRLPMESPQRDAWSRLALEIRPPAGPAGRMSRWAVAAAIAALAIGVPLAWFARDAAAPEGPVLATQAPMPLATPEPVNVPAVGVGDKSQAAFAEMTRPAEQRPLSVADLTPGNANPPPATQVAAIEPVRAGTVAKPLSVVDATAIGQDPLAGLYTESAQLEALLLQIQDQRVYSGPAAALTSQYESRLATIDASLSDPALPDDLRMTLWGERVDALRELVGFEATQRWLSARGERYDGQLVAVY